MLSLVPSFPAVTCTVQASISTGADPSLHGMVSNGYYDRERLAVGFWEQSDRLVQARRVWEAAREQDPAFTSAMLFWQNSIGSTNDIIVTPKPIHKHSGGMIQSCYSRPSGLYEDLVSKVGKFSLFWYWGPFASKKSTAWITECTRTVIEEHHPNLVLTYLPHLDYCQQRQGPTGKTVSKDLKFVDDCLGEVFDVAEKNDYAVIVGGDYGIDHVDQALFPNRMLREHELLRLYVVNGREYLDYGQSRAFAMVDHQIAHIFCDSEVVTEVHALLSTMPGVEQILTQEHFSDYGIDHPRSGELILIAAKGYWFAYPWWHDPPNRPDFATHVDIHNKPGFDPLELFWEGHPFRVAQDTSRVLGSHGRPPDEDSLHPALVTSFKPQTIPSKPRDTDIFNLVLEALGLSQAEPYLRH